MLEMELLKFVWKRGSAMRLKKIAATVVLSILLFACNTARGEGIIEGVAGLLKEGLLTTGDVVELGYRVHPGARLGRKAGLLPPGKLGLIPSHRSGRSFSGSGNIRYYRRIPMGYVRTPSVMLYNPTRSSYLAYRRRAAAYSILRKHAMSRQLRIHGR